MRTVKDSGVIGAVKARRPLLGAVLGALFLGGCATGPGYVDAQKVSTIDERSHALMTDRLVAESAKFRAMQDELFKQLERVQAEIVQPVEPRLNPLDRVTVGLRMNDADVRMVFQAIAEHAELNLILPASLSERPRTISLALRDMPASQALNHVLRTLDLHGEVDRNVLVIQDYQERVFDLDFLQTSISASFDAGGDVFGANQSLGGGSGQGGGSGGAGQSGVRNGFNLSGRNTNDIDPFTQVEDLLRAVIVDERGSAQEGRGSGPRYSLNRSTGTLYVRARPSQVNTVSRLVDTYRQVLGRQVLIEAQILDIALNDDFRYGIDWTRLRDSAALHLGANPLTMAPINSTVPGAENVARAITIPGFAPSGGAGTSLSAAYANSRHSVAIDMLKAFGAVHVLSNPSLRVKNTQPAVVSVGRNERYIAETTSNITVSGGADRTVSSNVVTGDLFDGVMLGVIPFISDNGVINLTINPVQTSIDPDSMSLVQIGGSGDQAQAITLPKVDFKGITTSLSLRDGDTVILGGLISEQGNRGRSGVPGISEVPLLGEAFGQTATSSRSRELVVILSVRQL